MFGGWVIGRFEVCCEKYRLIVENGIKLDDQKKGLTLLTL